MRTFRSCLGAGIRFLAVLALVGLAVVAVAQGKSVFTVHEKAYYADPAAVVYVQPGLNITVVSANIAANGTITVDYKLTDPTGRPLTRAA